MAFNAPIFDYCPDYEPVKAVDPRLISAKFGDGYSQEAPDGLNHMPETRKLEFQAVDRADADAMEALLKERGGYLPFYWVEPTGRYSALYTCKAWDRREVGPVYDTLTVTFEQNFSLPNQLQPWIDAYGGYEALIAASDELEFIINVSMPEWLDSYP